MDAERWRQIEELYHSALDSDVAERAKLLAHADPEVRREVESLLAQPTADTPLDRSAFSAVDRPHLEGGALIGPYRIEGLLGEGGMGVVYRAFDPKLKRPVAIKLLPDLADVAARHRFEREARTVTALNHPHILTVYDVGELDGRQYLVTELVDGGTLRSWAAAEKRSWRQIVDVLAGVADGLATAHEAGIIHRDIKPENILIAKNGYAKLADFGLAKLFQRDGDETSTRIALSHPGVIAGTIGYMSPEQASGMTVDARSDIFSFGAVLYELFAGQRPFSGKSDLEELQRIVHAMPEPLGGQTPLPLRMVVEKALEKDPADRYQTTRELVVDLRRVSRQSGSGYAPETRSPREADTARASEIASDSGTVQFRQSRLSWRAAAVWFLGGLGLATAVTLWLVQPPQTPPTFGPVRFQIPPGVRLTPSSPFSVSPDGRHLVFAAAGDDSIVRLWVRSMDSLAIQPLSGTEVALGGLTPPMFWSPDSRFVAFDAAGQLKKVDVGGGAPQKVCDLPVLAVGGAWNRHDVIIVGSPKGGLTRCPASGGTASVVTELDSSRGESGHVFPSFLPDGRHFLYLRVSRNAPENSAVFLRALETGSGDSADRRILATPFGAAYVPGVVSGIGRILFVRDAALYAQPFDERRLELSGNAIRVAEPIGSFLDGAFFSASTSGVLVFRGPDEDRQLTWFDPRGNILDRASEPGRYRGLTLDPSGTRAVAVRRADGATVDQDLWLVELSGSRASKVTFDSRLEEFPVWSHDGKKLFFTAGGGIGPLFEQSLSGTDAAQVLLRTEEHLIPTSASPDGRFLLYCALNIGETRADLWVLPLQGDRKPFPFLRRAFDQCQGQFSPDGRWVAYVSNESGRYEVLVRPFTPSGAAGAVESTVVSQGGGIAPRWRSDGKELFYLAANGTVTSVALTTALWLLVLRKSCSKSPAPTPPGL